MYRAALTSNAHPLIFAHSSAPVAVAAHPTSSFHFLSASQDSVVRMWDSRSAKAAVASFDGYPAQTAGKKGGKLLSVDWGVDSIVGVAGEDGVGISRAAIE